MNPSDDNNPFDVLVSRWRTFIFRGRSKGWSRYLALRRSIGARLSAWGALQPAGEQHPTGGSATLCQVHRISCLSISSSIYSCKKRAPGRFCPRFQRSIRHDESAPRPEKHIKRILVRPPFCTPLSLIYRARPACDEHAARPGSTWVRLVCMRELADAFQWELEHDATAVWPHTCGLSRLRDLNVKEGFFKGKNCL